jgi:outer membrane protein assembly factor BamA
MIFIILLFINVGRAAVEIHGLKKFDGNSLSEIVRHSSNLDIATAKIDQRYLSAGYFSESSTLEVEGNDTVLTIDEGRRYKLADLAMIGAVDSITSAIVRGLDQSMPLDSSGIRSVLTALCRSYANIGYPFCAVNVDNFVVEGDSLKISGRVVKGPESVVGKVSFTGLTATEPTMLYRRLSLRARDKYNENALEKSLRSLKRLTYCRPTGKPLVLYDNRLDAADVVFPMHDEKNVTIDGMAFLNPDNSLAGRANLNLRNLFGDGEELNFLYSKFNSTSKQLRLSGSYPYLGGAPLDLKGELSQEDRDSSFVSTSVNLGADYGFGERWSLGSRFEWEKITPEEGRPTPSARLLSVGLNVRFDGRDDIRRTTKGFYVTQQLKSSYRRSFETGGDIASGYSTHLDASLLFWRQVRRGLVFFQKVSAFQISSDFAPLPVDQLIPVGGLESLRGYRDNSFLARNGVLGSSELRWYALENLLIHGFCDNAYISTPQNDFGLTGFGAGMVIATSAGSFHFDVSLGEEKSFSSMLVHFGFSGEL